MKYQFLILLFLISILKSCAQTKGIEKIDDFGSQYFTIKNDTSLTSNTEEKLKCLLEFMMKYEAEPKKIVFIAHEFTEKEIDEYNRFLNFKNKVLLFLVKNNSKFKNTYYSFYWGNKNNGNDKDIGMEVQVYCDTNINGKVSKDVLFDFSKCHKGNP